MEQTVIYLLMVQTFLNGTTSLLCLPKISKYLSVDNMKKTVDMDMVIILLLIMMLLTLIIQ